MAAPPQSERQSGPFTLPSIATMTQRIGQDKSPKHAHSAGDMMRDSGMWSMQSPSKRKSTKCQSERSHAGAITGTATSWYTLRLALISGLNEIVMPDSSTISSATGLSSASSSNGLQLQTILNSSDESSHRFSSASATSAGTPASARLSNQQHLPHLGRSYDGANPHDSNPRASIDANNTFFIDSRRSSIDSRVGVNMGGLAITPSSSPYENNNASHTTSQASIGSNLQQTRTPPHGTHVPHLHTRSNGPIPRRPVTSGGAQPPRRAPPITANPRSGGMPNPNASTPTKGFAWAFPEHPDKEDGDDDLSPEPSRQGSLASSSNTMDSSSYLPHALQHKAVTSLQSAESLIGSGNYSRTPELRISHKLAERKRRSEMKDLFDSLNHAIPNSPGNKSSKWEVLSKAIDYIEGLKRAFEHGQKENRQLRSELEVARTAQDENQHLTNEVTAMYQQLCRVDPNGHHVFGPFTNHLVSKDSQPSSRAGPGFAMQGVEYPHQYDRR